MGLKGPPTKKGHFSIFPLTPFKFLFPEGYKGHHNLALLVKIRGKFQILLKLKLLGVLSKIFKIGWNINKCSALVVTMN